MVKCNKGQQRRLKRALRGRKHPAVRQRIQMVLLRESGMTQPAIAEAMGVSLSTVNRAPMAYDQGGLKALAACHASMSARRQRRAHLAPPKRMGCGNGWSARCMARQIHMSLAW